MIKLIDDNSISKQDIDILIEWLKSYPRLTKNGLTIQFEKEFAKLINTKYSVFVNSGSSANLLMIYALNYLKQLKNKKILVPALCWSTTIAPLIQFGFEPIIVDVCKKTLAIDLEHLHKLIRINNPAALFLVHPLGFMQDMDIILDECKNNNILLLEDSCETLQSKYKNKTAGSFGIMSSFSGYYSHHISTIEGGLIGCNDKNIYELLLQLRSHGWDRDLSIEKQKQLRSLHTVSEFDGLYTFYLPGFNLRSTEINARIGLEQLKKIDSITDKREENFNYYQKYLINDYWKISPNINQNVISNFAYPIIHPKRAEIVKELNKEKIECRPLICGNIANQPFIKHYIKNIKLEFADIIHKYGLYVPNHTSIDEEDIKLICDIINEVIC